MSDGRKDDIRPDWSGTDMDWLDDIISEYSAKNEPRQTPVRPEEPAQPKPEIGRAHV